MKTPAYFAACIALALTTSAQAQQAPDADKNPDAMAALTKMGAYVRTLKSFQITAETVREHVLNDGQKVSFSGTSNMLVERPNRLRVEVANDLAQRTYIYDGKSITVFADLLGYYATTQAPPTLAKLVDRLADRFDIELPLADLFYWGTDQSRLSAITSALDIGPGTVGGVTCEHYVFRQPGVDWQIWIQLGDYPLPRKLIITTTTDEARPQYSSVLTWNLAPSFNDAAFQFEPPANAQRIAIAEIAADSASKAK